MLRSRPLRIAGHWGAQAEREFDELLHQPNTDVAEMMKALRLPGLDLSSLTGLFPFGAAGLPVLKPLGYFQEIGSASVSGVIARGYFGPVSLDHSPAL